MQGRNRDSEIENRIPGTAGEREGGTNGERSIEIHTLGFPGGSDTLPRVKQRADGTLLYSAKSSAWGSVTT